MTFTVRRWQRTHAATATTRPLPLAGHAGTGRSATGATQTAVLVGALLLSGCTGTRQPHASGTPTPAGPTAQTTTSPAAEAALATAVAQTRRLRSYSFDSLQSLTGGKQPQQTRIRGRAIRPSSLAYDLTLGGKTEQVIRIGARSYLRIPPAGWKSVARPAAVDLLRSLLQLLQQFTPQTVTSSTSSKTLTGTVPGAALTAAGLAPAGAQAPTQTPVTVTLDPAGHVTGLSIALNLQAGSVTLHLAETSHYGSFNTAAAIRAPGKLRSRPLSH